MSETEGLSLRRWGNPRKDGGRWRNTVIGGRIMNLFMGWSLLSGNLFSSSNCVSGFILMSQIVSSLVDEALCEYQQATGDIDLARFTMTPTEDNPKLWSQGDVGCLVSQRRFCIIYVRVDVRFE